MRFFRISCMRRNLFILIIVASILILTTVFFNVQPESQSTQFLHSIKDNFPNRRNNNSDSLIDLNEFKFQSRNNEICSMPTNTTNTKRLLLFLISSSRDDFEHRDLARRTWASVKSAGNWEIRHVFLLGESNSTKERSGLSLEIQQEFNHNDDMIIGNFEDSYRNLTYKDFMGYKWALKHCSNAEFVVKTDSDVFIEIFQLTEFMDTLVNYNGLIVGSINQNSKPIRDKNEKWFVSEKEYPKKVYPTYCIGMGVVMSFDVVSHLVNASEYVPYFWISDVYTTGFLREFIQNHFKVKIQLFDISHRYIFTGQKEYEDLIWGVKERDKDEKFPWFFVHCWNNFFIGQFLELWFRIYKSG